MNLNIQRFDEDLDFKPAQTEAFVSTVNREVPKITSAIDDLTNGVNKLVEDWGDGHAKNEGNEFTKAYRNLAQHADAYVNSIGDFASSVGNAFCQQYNISTSFSFSKAPTQRVVNDFNEINKDGGVGPVDAGVSNRFKPVYENSISAITSALQAIDTALSSNRDAFVESTQNKAEESITTHSQAVRTALNNTSEAYTNYLDPYLSAAVELKSKADSAADGGIGE